MQKLEPEMLIVAILRQLNTSDNQCVCQLGTGSVKYTACQKHVIYIKPKSFRAAIEISKMKR